MAQHFFPHAHLHRSSLPLPRLLGDDADFQPEVIHQGIVQSKADEALAIPLDQGAERWLAVAEVLGEAMEGAPRETALLLAQDLIQHQACTLTLSPSSPSLIKFFRHVNSVAVSLIELGFFQESMNLLKLAISSCRAHQSSNQRLQIILPNLIDQLGALYLIQDSPQPSIPYFQEALKIFQSFPPKIAREKNLQKQWAQCFCNYYFALRSDQPNLAFQQLRKSNQIYEKLLKQYPSDSFLISCFVSNLFLEIKNYISEENAARVSELCQKGFEIIKKLEKSDFLFYARSQLYLFSSLGPSERGEYPLAIESLEKSIYFFDYISKNSPLFNPESLIHTFTLKYTYHKNIKDAKGAFDSLFACFEILFYNEEIPHESKFQFCQNYLEVWTDLFGVLGYDHESHPLWLKVCEFFRKAKESAPSDPSTDTKPPTA